MNEAKPYVFSGKVIVKKEIQEISDTFKKLEIVIDTGGDYPETIPVEAINDTIDLLNPIKRGDLVEITANVKGRQGKGKFEHRHFLSLAIWKIKKIGEDVPVEENDFIPDDPPF